MKVFIDILAIALLIYGAQLYIRQWRLIFRPSKKQMGTPQKFGLSYEDLYLESSDGNTLHAWWVSSDNARHTVLYFHGTIGNISYELNTVNFLHRLGVNVLAIDYPGYGRSKGRPNQKGVMGAADVAWRYLNEKQHVQEQRVVIYGRSIGSVVASYLATKIRCKALVIHGGITSIPDMAAQMYPYLPVRWFCHTRLNLLNYIRDCVAPVLVLHSKQDTFVPIKFAEKIYAAVSAPKKMIYISGGHFGDNWLWSGHAHSGWKEILTDNLNWPKAESQHA